MQVKELEAEMTKTEVCLPLGRVQRRRPVATAARVIESMADALASFARAQWALGGALSLW